MKTNGAELCGVFLYSLGLGVSQSWWAVNQAWAWTRLSFCFWMSLRYTSVYPEYSEEEVIVTSTIILVVRVVMIINIYWEPTLFQALRLCLYIPNTILTIILWKVKSVSHWVVSDCLRPHVCSPPDSFLYGIFQARIVEWVAMPFCSGSPLPRDWTHVSYVSCTGSLPLAPPGPSYEVSTTIICILLWENWISERIGYLPRVTEQSVAELEFETPEYSFPGPHVIKWVEVLKVKLGRRSCHYSWGFDSDFWRILNLDFKTIHLLPLYCLTQNRYLWVW